MPEHFFGIILVIGMFFLEKYSVYICRKAVYIKSYTYIPVETLFREAQCALQFLPFRWVYDPHKEGSRSSTLNM